MPTRLLSAQEKIADPGLPRRLLLRACLLEGAGAILFWVFTKSPVCSIISLSGAAISIASFMTTVKLADRVLAKRRGKLQFIVAEMGKAVAIVLFFVFFSPLSLAAVIAFVFGLSVIYLAVMAEGMMVLWHSWFNHGT